MNRRACTITEIAVRGGTLVRLEGKIDETFQVDVISQLGGVVIFDLAGVRTINSRGVLNWRTALCRMPADYYGFVHCRPMVVQQFNMVGGFAQAGELVSLYLPFVCPRCEESLETLLDLRTERDRIASLDLPEVDCPSCLRPTEFDDIPELYLSYAASQPAPRPPYQASAIIDRHGSRPQPSRVEIKKDVADTVTALWLAGRFDKKAYFKRVADGLQGPVILILAEVEGLAASGRDGLTDLVASVPEGVHLARVPTNVVDSVMDVCASSGLRVRSVSLRVPAECADCGLITGRDLDSDQLRALRSSTLVGEGDRPTIVDLDSDAAAAESGPDSEDTATDIDFDLLESAPVPEDVAAALRCPHCEQPMSVSMTSEQLAAALSFPSTKTPEPVAQYLRTVADTSWRSADDGRSEPAAAIQGDFLIDRYRVIRQLGEGGMGQVLLARHVGTQNFEKLVVIKRIRRDLLQNQRVLNLFLSEARTAAKLSHRNIVQIFDLGKTDDGYFICMEYVNGIDLAEALSLSKEAELTWPVEVCCRIVSELCAALHAAHTFVDEEGRAAPIIHRDASPSNVLLSVDGAVKLADFGVAKTIGESSRTHTEPGTVMGKVGYAAPEQLLGSSDHNIDRRVDIYAAGVVLYECLTLRPFVETQSDLGAVRRALFEPPPRLRAAREDVPAELESIYGRAVARDPSDRFPTAGALQDALEGVLVAQGRAATSNEIAAWIERIVALRKRDDAIPFAPTAHEDPPLTANLKGKKVL